MKEVTSLLEKALAESVFPGAVVWVSKDKETIYNGAFGVTEVFAKTPVTLDTIYDLASLTKPLATTMLALKLLQQGVITLDDSIAKWMEGCKHTPKEKITIEQLLLHRSGLPVWEAFWYRLSGISPDEKEDRLCSAIVHMPLVSDPGVEERYSDVGFILLQKILEKVAGAPLNDAVRTWVYDPMFVGLFFGPDKEMTALEVAATELCAHRKGMMKGVVHDENAWAMGGVAGHAGLFGTAEEVYKLLQKIQDAFDADEVTHGLDPMWVRRFLTRKNGCGRVLGFDCPNMENASCGRYFSDETVGHLGFTGTSFWMDLKEKVMVILLTNRVHPSRYNQRIRDFRPVFHDRVWQALLS